jgi:hypothetical protein
LLMHRLVTRRFKNESKHKSLLIVALELRRLVGASGLTLVGAVIEIIFLWLGLIERMRTR